MSMEYTSKHLITAVSENEKRTKELSEALSGFFKKLKDPKVAEETMKLANKKDKNGLESHLRRQVSSSVRLSVLSLDFKSVHIHVKLEGFGFKVEFDIDIK